MRVKLIDRLADPRGSHHTFTLLFDGKLFQAPIAKNPQVRSDLQMVFTRSARMTDCNERQRVLDVGTGTGIWALYVTWQRVDKASHLC